MAYLELRGLKDFHEPKVHGAELIIASDGTPWVKLPRVPFAVGRSPHVAEKPHLKLAEITLSRGHFSVLPHDGGYAVRDDGSTAGTYLNDGEIIKKRTLRPLQDGDKICLGGPSSGLVAIFHTGLVSP